MTDDALQKLEALKVKARDLVRFLSATRKTKMCYQCGEEKWVLHTESSEEAENPADPGPEPAALDLDGEVIVFELSIADRQAFQPSAMLHCASCGTMTLINYGILHQWVTDNPEQDN